MEVKLQTTTVTPGVPILAYDGGQIDVIWDNHEMAVQWYEKHMGFTRKQVMNGKNERLSTAEIMTELRAGLWLKSVLTERRVNHFFAERGTVDSNVRWCHAARDLEAEHANFQKEGIRTSEIYYTVDGKGHFDFWGFEGTRLTAAESQDIQDGSRFGGSWVRIGVRNLQEARTWYERYLGMILLEDYSAKGSLKMGLPLEHHPDTHSVWWLDQLPEDAPENGIVDGPCRPYCVTHDGEAFAQYFQYLRASGIRTSDYITGGFFAFFHFYDPDGNRVNIYKY
ncbi:VOC family protein [Paenibacillus sp. KS-LC4]|uniref:VOC family protein n=1 Tax=Paenibacillus sp. KS-LC4 TaxID=2979727 RepID=UPI0030D36031